MAMMQLVHKDLAMVHMDLAMVHMDLAMVHNRELEQSRVTS